MTGVIGGFFERCGLRAMSEGRHFTGYDLGVAAFEALSTAEGISASAKSALKMLATIDLTKLARTPEAKPDAPTALFGVEEARIACEGALNRASFRGRAAMGVIYWIARTGFDDVAMSFGVVREAIGKIGLTPELALGIEAERRGAFPIGVPIDPAGEIVDALDLSGLRLVGRHAQIAQHQSALQQALIRGEHYLLLGNAGVGKTAFARRVVESLLRAQRTESDPRLADLRFLWVGRHHLLGSAVTARGNFETLARVIEGGATPVIDDLDLLLSPRFPVSEEAIRTLGHEFVAGTRSFVLIAEQGQARQLAYLSHLSPHRLPALAREPTERIAADHLNAVVFKDPLLSLGEGAESLGRAVAQLRRKNYADRSSPAGELRLIDGAAEMLRMATGPGEAAQTVLDRDALMTFVARDLNMPREMVERDGPGLLAMLREQLLGLVIAQDHAVESVARAVAFGERTSTGETPRARLLLMGPPGVGKTHLASALAETLGYGQDAFIRLNMSEFSSDGARTRFLGADPGYVGFGATRTIFDHVRERPSCVILLDEIDRAHASIQDILLSILEGHGADASGRPVFFSQTIILATTNLGQEQIEARWREGEARGESRSAIAEALDDALLRDLVLTGALDETEHAMQHSLDGEVARLREAFRNAEESRERASLIDIYMAARQRREALGLQRRHCPLDRAFLDRIDFVVPFLPIATPDVVGAIVDAKLHKVMWADCPAEVRAEIVREVLVGGSVRMIERLVKRHLTNALLAASSGNAQ